MLFIPLFVVYSFLYCFFFTFFCIPEAARAAWTDSTPFRQPSLFSHLRWKISETKQKLKRLCARYHIINKDGRLATETNKGKKFKGSFQYKAKYNTTWFSQESWKNYKDVITNSKFYFYCKICTKDTSCRHGGASNLLRHCNSVTHLK